VTTTLIENNTETAAVVPADVKVAPRTHMYFDANEIMPEADPYDKREACVQAAIAFARECGCNESDSLKMRDALIGRVNPSGVLIPGPMALITWRLYMCNVSALVRAQDKIWEPMSGKLRNKSKSGTKYEITLRPHSLEDKQISLGLCVQKKGSIEMDASGENVEQPDFWTYANLILQTEDRQTKAGVQPGMPLALAYDVHAAAGASGKTKVFTGDFSRRLYLDREINPLTGREETVDRLRDIVMGGNSKLVFLGALVDAEFPVHTARINRNPVNQNGRWQANRKTQPARTPVAAGNVRETTISEDPFADETA
jgi:hypothetical protein